MSDYDRTDHYEALDESATADQLECLEDHDGKCQGEVNWHTTGSRLKAFPRCDWHQDRRQHNYENSMERYADSDVPPAWFDPLDAGETW